MPKIFSKNLGSHVEVVLVHKVSLRVVQQDDDVVAVPLHDVLAHRVVEGDGRVGSDRPGVVGEVQDADAIAVAERMYRVWPK